MVPFHFRILLQPNAVLSGSNHRIWILSPWRLCICAKWCTYAAASKGALQDVCCGSCPRPLGSSLNSHLETVSALQLRILTEYRPKTNSSFKFKSYPLEIYNYRFRTLKERIFRDEEDPFYESWELKPRRYVTQRETIEEENKRTRIIKCGNWGLWKSGMLCIHVKSIN